MDNKILEFNLEEINRSAKKVLLGDIVQSIKGKKPKNLSSKKSEKLSLPYVNIQAFEKGIVNEYTDGEGCVICEEGDFLMVWDGSRSGMVGKAINGALGSTLVKLTFPNMDNDYAFYFLQSKFAEINTRAKGVGIPHVDPNLLWNYELRIPPLKEQQAIVSKIEELFSELDKGIESLKTAFEQLKIYKQAVLKWAFEGRLTYENVKDGELPEGWEEQEIKSICENIKVGIVIKPTNFYSKSGRGIKAFRSANVRELKVDDTDWVYFSEEANEINFRTKLKEGDVLLVRSGYPGTSCVVTKEFEGCNAIDILIATPDRKKVIPKYLCLFNNSPLGKGMFLSKSRGVAQKHLNVGEYSKLKIFVPSIKEQNKIIYEIENRLTVADKMESSINESLLQSEALRQSILKQAFEGRLV